MKTTALLLLLLHRSNLNKIHLRRKDINCDYVRCAIWTYGVVIRRACDVRAAERIMPVVLAITPRINRNIRWVGHWVEVPVLKDMCLRCLYAILWLLNAYVI